MSIRTQAANRPRHLAACALAAARATLSSEPALPGARSLATYRRAMSAAWRAERATRGRLRADWRAAADLLAVREAVA